MVAAVDIEAVANIEVAAADILAEAVAGTVAQVVADCIVATVVLAGLDAVELGELASMPSEALAVNSGTVSADFPVKWGLQDSRFRMPAVHTLHPVPVVWSSSRWAWTDLCHSCPAD